MDILSNAFPIILYCLGSILLIVVIVLVVKLISTVDKTNELLDDLNKKSKSLDGVFDVIDTATNVFSTIGDKFIDGIISFISKIFYSKRKKEKESDIDE